MKIDGTNLTYVVIFDDVSSNEGFVFEGRRMGLNVMNCVRIK